MAMDDGAGISINHVGLTVDDLDKAICFYQEALSFQLISGPMDIVRDNSYWGKMALDLCCPRLKGGRFAHLVDERGTGLELFSFDDPEAGPRELEYWRNGYFHMCVTAPDVDALVARVEQAGGSRRTRTWEIAPGSSHYLVYCNDPFGNAIEIYNAPYRTVWGGILATSAVPSSV